MPRTRRTTTTTTTTTVAAVTLSLTGLVLLTAPAASAVDDPVDVMLAFDGDAATDGYATRQSGTSGVVVRTVTANGGSLTSVADALGGGAVRLPAFSSTNPRAALSVVDVEGADDLAPGTGGFVVGADFAIDRVTTGSSRDDGNNLVQRGLYNDAAQIKIQVDAGRPACRLKGSAGAVLLKSPVTVQPGAWYRTSCGRTNGTLALTLVRMSDGVTWRSTSGVGIGSLTYAASTPFSVGGKLSSATTFTGGSSDQFNGVVDRAFIDVR